jgi:modulator of FtsH protease HflK
MSKHSVAMAWNEPGGNGKNNQNPNPWGNKGKDQGPPDLDQIIKNFINKIKANFNFKTPSFGNRNGGGGMGGGGGRKPFSNQKELGYLGSVIIIGLVILYLISGVYIVDPPERAVMTRFGKYIQTKGPGPHWMPPIIESKEIVNVEQVHTSDHNGLMLTKDRNIASVGIAVQYKIGSDEEDVRAFLFNVVNPIQSLKLSAESALRQVIGQSTMDEVLTLKRSEIAIAIKEQIIETLKPYKTGIAVLDVAMQFAKAPDEVRSAFDEVIKAAADEERLVNQARAYENEVLPRARGNVERLRNEALGYKGETVLNAEGNVQRFNQILPEYKKAPKVTQTRLYLDTMEEIFSKTTKILVEGNGNNNMMYLPLDKLIPAKEVSEPTQSEIAAKEQNK